MSFEDPPKAVTSAAIATLSSASDLGAVCLYTGWQASANWSTTC